ncbi:3-oxoacyl-[acyl-carrier-protein] synthase 3 [Rosistilla carotiformis]|uniref:3-oxoacyl-[acyl-carrier-protein] synthase 3 n=1 Tax=Rosistilla carotiformis TaxID=2528017 RepID=A0A518JYF2_9BACT|nr:3-oxoacyl-[acyl-carrier-protein] synthase III C-terminal domain-containing protein [Rosistilla carotiformis]QDV70565.1 3-oxoacyl-[acyl-carrier-protein] synthase 3 [Rosistilla carotiformis]
MLMKTNDTMLRTVIESIGAYLPSHEVTTDEIVQGCERKVRVPLAKLTGIRSRRRAGVDEFSIDLAEKAVSDCLNHSALAADQIEAIVCTNISRWDSKNSVTFEPATSVRLKSLLGLDNAIAIDISNACAGMWTGVYMIDALIRSGAIRSGMVVSGEYITHLIDTAQKEIVDFMDPQLASLTLGDAGVALTLTAAGSTGSGFHDLDMYTLSKYSQFCVAKPTDKPHGGAAMYTDAIKVTESVVPHAARHAKDVLDRNEWGFDAIGHVIPHQTSKLTMQEGMREIKRLFDYDLSQRLINNLEQRGNTSSNAHFLALHDAMRRREVKGGDSIVFCISGSGQTTGTALYVCDDLPERINAEDAQNGKPRREIASTESALMPIQLQVESLGIAYPPTRETADTLTMLQQAGEQCLKQSSCEKQDIDILIAACTYRTEFIMEPAIAALLAGRMEINFDREPEAEDKTFAFDVINGEIGMMKSLFLASEFIRAGRGKKVMVVGSEVDNNAADRPDQSIDVSPMASALIVQESVDATCGFLSFHFQDFTQFKDLRKSEGYWNQQGQACMNCTDQPEALHAAYLDCIETTVANFLQTNELTREDIARIVPSPISSAFVADVATRLQFPAEKVLDISDANGSLMSSAIPVGLKNLEVASGEMVLFISVSPGIQIGCALYMA